MFRRILGEDAIPGSDGQCGPSDGPQCDDCKATAPVQAVAAAAAGAFVVGARVRVVCEKPAKGWGSVKRYDEGVLKSISGADCVIDFEKHKGWAGLLSELELVAGGTFGAQALDVLLYRDTRARVVQITCAFAALLRCHGVAPWVEQALCFHVSRGLCAGAAGCDAACTKSHGSDGNCLKCGKAWGPHNGHNCPSGGGRGSWAVAGAVALAVAAGAWYWCLFAVWPLLAFDMWHTCESDMFDNLFVCFQSLCFGGVDQEWWSAGGAFSVGARVRIICEKPAYGWGSVKRYDEGTIVKISGDSVDVDFAAQKSWSGKLSEFELVSACTPACSVESRVRQTSNLVCFVRFVCHGCCATQLSAVYVATRATHWCVRAVFRTVPAVVVGAATSASRLSPKTRWGSCTAPPANTMCA